MWWPVQKGVYIVDNNISKFLVRHGKFWGSIEGEVLNMKSK